MMLNKKIPFVNALMKISCRAYAGRTLNTEHVSLKYKYRAGFNG